MANFSLWATFGLCLLKLCLAETQFNVSCRYGGVFHVEKNGRYSLTRPEAVKLCRALNSTLATLEQLKKAHELGFETCRYGFVVGHIVIPRIRPYHLCAANHTGIYKLPANTTGRYDAYCYNETETRDIGCEPVEKLDTSLLSNQDEIVIDNADGSRYNADGTRHTSGESSTSGADDENVGSGSTHETTPMDTSVRRSSPSYYGSATPVSQLPDHTSGGGEKGTPGKDYDYEVPSLSPDISFGTVADDFHEEDGGHYHTTTTVDSQHETLLEISTQDHWNPTLIDEEEQYPSSPSRALVTSENEKHQGPTQHPLPYSIHSGGISQEQNPANTTASIEQHEFTIAGESYFEKESSHTAMVSTHGAKQNDSMQDPWIYPGWDNGEEYATRPAIMDRTIPSRGNNHEKGSSTTGSTSSIYGNEGPRKGHHESTTFPGETATTKIDSQPRSARVPEWLIIVAALVALVLILAVCIAVNSRRRCGQKKKLVINNGKGAVEDRKSSALNGDISKSQEMVHLVHKERSNDRTQACDELLTVNETQNHQDLDMKTGV
ncbi:CD44 antigen isoform X3 [Corapipo altera]|uniref:CD44 antigen isoform X3 n=1 Tax=Corapipo altera TaxID=415028 RepID=UPI000FD6637D|nr:CD44 antigen isoform X3 [Corapipo altera]